MKKNIIKGSFFSTIGIAIILFSFFLNNVSLSLTNLIARAFIENVPIYYLQNYVNGLLAGGHIIAIPIYMIFILLIIGVFLFYIGVNFILLRHENSPLSIIFSKEYCTSIQYNFTFLPKENKKEILTNNVKQKK